MDSSNKDLITKHIITPGKVKHDYQDGTKVYFHVKSETVKDEKLLDDSRKWSQPIDLILGKKFKLEVWEACVRTMMVGEVAKFIVDKKLVTSYPIVSRTLRDYHAKKAGNEVPTRSHQCCGIGMKEGFGYPDLDALVTEPQDLQFTIELLNAEGAGSYQKEFWAMTEQEQRESVDVLRQEGNKYYKEGDIATAAKKYSEAIGRLENLMLKEKPNDVEWDELNCQKLPLLLNYSQCQLLSGEYYSVIEHCSDVIKHQPENVKALFRRGKAYVKVFSPKEAKEDIELVAKLDSSLASGCKKLLDELAMSEKEKLEEDKKVFKKLFS